MRARCVRRDCVRIVSAILGIATETVLFASFSPRHLPLRHRRPHLIVPYHRQALEAELSGDYDVALDMYQKLLKLYDTRYERDSQSQLSLHGLNEAAGEDAQPMQEKRENKCLHRSMLPLFCWVSNT